jgi:glycosyltransferase involved in cell wall biosynthesis
MIVGIDASNIRAGGGLTHLRELLAADAHRAVGISRVIVWSGFRTLDVLPDVAGLEKRHEPALDGPLWRRALWQNRALSGLARASGCDVLFIPGGTYAGDFSPFVVMSQNVLPFMPEERARYRFSVMRLKYHLLQWTQSRTFRRADGVIFLTEGARKITVRRVPGIVPRQRVISHGVNARFARGVPPNQGGPFSPARPFRWLYVSIIDPYKHQVHVAEAAGLLLREGLPVRLDFVGPVGWPREAQALLQTIARHDPAGKHLYYRGQMDYAELDRAYREADAFVFASSCESFGMILVEAMAAGLPVAASRRAPLPEIAGDAPVYFEPESVAEIAGAMRALTCDADLRTQAASRSLRQASMFSWATCARETFTFVAEIGRDPELRRRDPIPCAS